MKFPIKKYWWLGWTVAILTALIGILTGKIRESKILPSSVIQVEDTTRVEIAPLTPNQRELYDEAVMLWRDGVYTDALRKLDKLTSMRPDYVNAYIIRGRIYLENLKQYQNAVDEFRIGLEKDPHNKYLLYDLGLTYYHLGELSRAIQWNQKALEQDPDLIIGIYNHAVYYVDYGEKQKDTTYYHKAIELYENVINRDQEFAVSAMFNLAALYARRAKQEKDKNTKDQYVKKAVELLDRTIDIEGSERLQKVEGMIPVPYGRDLEAIRNHPDYIKMLEKWKNHFRS